MCSVTAGQGHRFQIGILVLGFFCYSILKLLKLMQRSLSDITTCTFPCHRNLITKRELKFYDQGKCELSDII